MKTVIATLLAGFLLIASDARAESVDYTSRSYLGHSCELFARDAMQAAGNFQRGVVLEDLIGLVAGAPAAESEKDRIFQAIELVWNNQLDNPVLAYTVAMGLCLKPRHEMAPMDEPWITSPRTISGHF